MDFLRQYDIIRPDLLNFPINVIGCGGIGSPVALTLAKMGCSRLALYDPDIVESHNLPNQVFPLNSLGRAKVEVLAEVIRQFTGCEPVTMQQALRGEEPLQGLCIIAVDTMKARKEIWRGIRQNPAVPLLIDARMGGEVGRLFCIHPSEPEEIDFYETTLYSDEEALELPCTARAVIYNGFMIAALIANLVKRYAVGEKLPKEIIADSKLLILYKEGSQL
jgi:hypothetical protein